MKQQVLLLLLAVGLALAPGAVADGEEPSDGSSCEEEDCSEFCPPYVLTIYGVHVPPVWISINWECIPP